MHETKGSHQVRSKRSRFALFGVLMLALSATIGLTAGSAQAKKLKPFDEQLAVNAAIPDDAATGFSQPLISTIEVGKKYKKRKVADVNVTNLQTSGSTAGAANDLWALLSSPNGRTIVLFAEVGPAENVNLGPWTLDDDTNISLCDDPPCENPYQQLNPPYAGTSNLLHNNQDNGDDLSTGPLSNFDGTRMRGTWTLTIWDENTAGTSSVLNQWGLEIKPLKLKPPTVEVD